MEAGLKHDDLPTHLDLFSGIGGFALAAKRCGFRTVGFCERSPQCRAWLTDLFPGVPQVEDVRDLDGRLYRGVTLLTGGFPCQPWSRAGKRRGQDDDRALWPEMRRIIQEARPNWIVGENVPGIIELALDDLLSDLEADGYEGGRLLFRLAPSGVPRSENGCFWYTPTARDGKGRSGSGFMRRKLMKAKGVSNLCDQAFLLGRRDLMLSPKFRLLLMGFPIHWLDAKEKPSETPSSRRLRRFSSDKSSVS